MEHTPIPEREQLNSTLQEKLTNFLNKLLDQAGLLAEKAHDVLRNFIPSSVPVFPKVRMGALLKFMRKHDKQRHKQSSHHHTPQTQTPQTVTQPQLS